MVASHEEHAMGHRCLAYVTGMVNQRLLLQNEYLAAENRILRAYLPKRLRALTLVKRKQNMRRQGTADIEEILAREPKLRLRRKQARCLS